MLRRRSRTGPQRLQRNESRWSQGLANQVKILIQEIFKIAYALLFNRKLSVLGLYETKMVYFCIQTNLIESADITNDHDDEKFDHDDEKF